MLKKFNRAFLSHQAFYKTSGYLLPWIGILFAILFLYGLIDGLFIAPPDYQQGDGFRIIYVHVPSALMAMAIYLVMAISALCVLVWRIKIAAICMACSAPIGASFTFLALVTGSIWGKPMWGTWWIWDARLTSVLILFFLYAGFMALRSVLQNSPSCDRASSIIALAGALNLPIIHYSVNWWHTLHQGPSITQFAKPAIASVMLYPLIAMIGAFMLFYVLVLLLRMRHQILLRDKKTHWVKEMIKETAFL